MITPNFVTDSIDPLGPIIARMREKLERRAAWRRPRDERGRFVKSKDTGGTVGRRCLNALKVREGLVEDQRRRKMAEAVRDAIMNGGGTVKMDYKPEPDAATEVRTGLLHVVRLALIKEIEDARTAVHMRRCGFALLAVQRMALKSTEGEATNTHEE